MTRRSVLAGFAALASIAGCRTYRAQGWCQRCGSDNHNTRWHDEYGPYLIDWDEAVRPNHITLTAPRFYSGSSYGLHMIVDPPRE